MTKQTPYQLGRALEYRVRDALLAKGFYVIRSPSSKGPADLVALGPGVQLLVQCKRSGRFDPGEWNELYDLAETIGALAIVASCPTGRGTQYKRLVGHKIPHKRKPPWEDYELLCSKPEGGSR